MTKIQYTDNTKYYHLVQQQKFSFMADGNEKRYRNFGRQFSSVLPN